MAEYRLSLAVPQIAYACVAQEYAIYGCTKHKSLHWHHWHQKIFLFKHTSTSSCFVLYAV